MTVFLRPQTAGRNAPFCAKRMGFRARQSARNLTGCCVSWRPDPMRNRGGAADRNRHSGTLRLGEGLLILVCVAAGRANRRTRAPLQWSATNTFLGPRFGEPRPRGGVAWSEAGSNRDQELTSDFYFHLRVRQADPWSLCCHRGQTPLVEGVPYFFSVELRCVLLATKTQYRIGPRRGAGH